MPLFEYRCGECGEVTEVLESRDSGEKHVCPKCGSEKMDKVFSAFGVDSRGGGSAPSGGGSCTTGTCPFS